MGAEGLIPAPGARSIIRERVPRLRPERASATGFFDSRTWLAVSAAGGGMAGASTFGTLILGARHTGLGPPENGLLLAVVHGPQSADEPHLPKAGVCLALGNVDSLGFVGVIAFQPSD